MTQPGASIRRKAIAISRRQENLRMALEALRGECPHAAPVYKYYGNTGNYDPSEDNYWINWSCPDCGARWNTPQGREHTALYPNAVKAP